MPHLTTEKMYLIKTDPEFDMNRIPDLSFLSKLAQKHHSVSIGAL